jgi:hypothetical protein
MIRRETALLLAILAALAFAGNTGRCENIDPNEDGSQYAYGANIGWLNFEPNKGPGVTVSSTQLTGYVWAANIGWVSLSCSNTNSCGTVDYGVVNDGEGHLSGYAWSANAGWISFSCENAGSCASVNYGVTIDENGIFDGWAYGQNIGWIHFRSASPIEYRVQTSWFFCLVDYDDLERFVSYWLMTGTGIPGDLDHNGKVDFRDYAVLAELWLEQCPSDWPLK